MQCDLLSKDDYTRILQSLYKTKEVQFIEAHLEPISEDVEGFLGEHHNLHVTFKLGTAENSLPGGGTDQNGGPPTTEIFFLKKKPQNNEIQIAISDGMNAYKKEIFFYNYLMKEFEKYGCDVTFAPKCVHVVEDEALIFENLKEKGFTLSDRHKKFNMEQIECALQALAKFHGAGITYDLKKTTELQRKYSFQEEFPDILEETLYVMKTNPTAFAMKWGKGAMNTLQIIINQLPGDAAYKEKFTSMVSQFEFGACFAQKANYVKTCGHGDLWSNNMMFKYVEGRPVECRLLDFQLCRYFYPAFDVAILVFGTTTPCFREKNLQKLYRYYYECLASVLAKQDYQLDDVMPFNEFLDTIKLVLRDAMLQTLNGLLQTNLPKDLLNSFLEGGNAEKLEKFLFDNGGICTQAFKTDEKYRNMVIEAFQEYYKILLSYE